ncbi:MULTISPECIES: acetyl-CoA carboxylase biotin carboxyl carrier protein [Agathobaculum]|uniref:Biotin carboxyl carrier protein of acetyl-CoA carboxylase n=1 Tax=Agathobaculum hominis TaxID=2763014 RepID=A0ABR7GNQ0_9FIRM|nr:acetyl-CoA carboxylase biotin carboxyl carrier protein [Agathobaculum hominis]MBC5695951.1 acetyl-CoA carboxylase biotin carboxyl carrier protein [Agathobaculum hominis]
MEINEIKDVALELMDALASKKLGEVAIELEGVKIKIKAAAPAPVIAAAPSAAAAPAASAAPAAAAAAETETAPADDLPAGTQVKSPLVGTFYSSPSPDEPPFVLVGQEVREGDTLCIIEAMKVMNEIKAPCSGKVVRIMAQPGDMVEYNQVLCIIE